MMREVYYSFQEQKQSSSFSSQSSRDKKEGANILSRALFAERWSSSLFAFALASVFMCVRVL
jgi:hypothetical protein